MATKNEAKNAWQNIMTYAISNSDKKSFSQADVTALLQKAIMTLNDYFTQSDEGEDDG